MNARGMETIKASKTLDRSSGCERKTFGTARGDKAKSKQILHIMKNTQHFLFDNLHGAH